MPGSVIASAVTISPDAQPGSHFCFCSSVPNEWRYGTMMSECRLIAKPLSYARASSSITIIEYMKSPPGAAVLLVEPRAQEALRARLAPHLAIDLALLAPARLVRHDLALDELAERLAERLVLGVEQRAVHAPP